MIKKIKLFLRSFYIHYVFAKYGLDEVILSIPIFKPFQFIAYINPFNWSANKNKSRAERIRLALEALGPIFVKFGQTLSTRPDLFPEDIIIELTRLQDKVPPFPAKLAVNIIEKEFERPITEVFEKFDPIPRASASVAQVHEVLLPNHKHGVVKIIRPGIKKIIGRDIQLLYFLARLTEWFWPDARRLRFQDVIKEFEVIIHDELDLMHEGANASQLRRNFINTPVLYIPEIYWDYSSTHVLTMEFVSGIPIADIDTLQTNGINLQKLAERGVEIFFTQVFRDSFFHADMHPGNIFVNPNKPQDPEYIAVDFGIMGTLSAEDQRYLALNILAFFRRDYLKVAELHVESGWVPRNTRIQDFQAAIRTVCEPIFERPLKEISFGKTLMRLFQVGRRFNMEVQPQLILLQKTLLHVEGLGRNLYPDLDLWQTAKPFLEDWMKRQVGAKAFVKKIYENIPLWAQQFPNFPEVVYEALSNIRNFSGDILMHAKQEEQKIEKTLLGLRRSFFSGIGFSLAIIAIFSYFLHRYQISLAIEHILGVAIAAMFFLALAVIFS